MTKNLYDIWREVLSRFPMQTALTASEGPVTYASFEERSRRLSLYLRDIGTSEAVIALPFGIDYFVALHACMRCGLKAIPLDPSLPGDVLNAHLERLSDVCVIMTRGSIHSPFDGPARKLYIEDIDFGSPFAVEDGRPDDVLSIHGDHPLHSLYTSGSSGRQTLVTIGQRSMAHHVSHYPSLSGLKPGSTHCCVGSHLSSLQINAFWHSLLNGNNFVPIDPKAEGFTLSRDRLMAARPDLLRGHPTLIGEVLDACRSKGPLTHTRRLILGGEPLKPLWLEKNMDLLPSLEEITYNYSSTETLLISAWTATPERFLSLGRIPAGFPAPGKEVMVVNESGAPVAIGEVGQIVVKSAFICSGLEGRDSHLRLESDDSSGLRMYRTGDLGSIREDGMLEHLGRVDRQIKINGVRIDPFLVEQCLEAHSNVESTHVMSVEGDGRTLLVAAYVSRTELKSESLRMHLHSMLPPSHQPSRYVWFHSLPRTDRGKPALQEIGRIVRERLSHGPPLKSNAIQTKLTETGESLVRIWSEIFPGMAVDGGTSLFESGADSLSILKMLFRVNEAFSVNIKLSDVYSDGRLGNLAERIDAERQKDEEYVGLMDMPARIPGERVPMSSAQRRMWMLQHMLANPSSYHIARMFDLPSGVGSNEVRSMLKSMADRHGILRTRLYQDEEGFWQEELPADDWRVDWDKLEAASHEELSSMLGEERERLFDLEKGLCWRARWVRENGSAPRLLVVFHHVAVDEWSMHLMGSELGMLLSGKSLPSKASGKDYGYIDFSRWQHWTFSSGLRERLESYWRERLGDMGEQIQFVTDFKTSDTVPGRSERVSLDFDAGIHALMDGYCRKGGLSRFSVWMSVWQVLQARMGWGEEVLLATPVSERDRPEWQEVWGMFLNTLPIRARVDGKVSFCSFSEAGHRSLARDLAHGQLSYEDIVRVADLDFGADGNGLPQVMFVLHGEHEWIKDEAATSDAVPWSGVTKNALSMHLTESGGAVRAMLSYDADRFKGETAGCILKRFESVARQVLENPGMRISDIDILFPGERERIMELSGRENVTPYPETTLQDIFRETAAQYPDRPAVIEADGRETSYEELKRQVDHIACFLRSKGVGRDVVVAVYMQRSPQMLASMLGILEAGGAFLLMEASLPLNRLQKMAEQARVLLIVSGDDTKAIPGFGERTYRFGDIMTSDISCDIADQKHADSSDLAYVMFTSGSTGIPKGAMVEHGNIINRLSFTRDAMCFGFEDRTLQKSPLSFDVCLTELLLPMFTGGAIVLADPGSEVDVQRMADLIVLHEASYVHFVPSVLQGFLQVPDVSKVNGTLKMIRCGGESLPDPLMRACMDTLDARLYQSYGPAETAVAVTLWRCHNGHGHPKPPIGWPNANVDILIMNNVGRPVPPGMPGELWIGGAQTGRGYINNEEETRKRFVDDPIEPGSGRRFYRSGDMARFLPDGNLLFLGRIDDQLKVRGVRIELGDVGAALLRCEGIKEAVVLAEPDGEGSNRLRAWVTCKDNFQEKEPAIRSSLSMLLPGYMIPFRIHIIDHIPLTSHGKTDHRALRAYATADADAAEGLPLTTPTEHSLAALWTELLGVPVQSRDADFFRLGGHSLMAMRLAGRIQKEYDIPLSLPDFYDDSRLENLAARIDEKRSGSIADFRLSDMPAAIPGERIPMSAAQRRMWMLQHLLTNPSAYHIEHILPIPIDQSPSQVRAILQQMAERHGILRTRLWQDDDGFWQQEMPVGDWRIDWAELETVSQMECIDLLSQQRVVAFDLLKANSWRARWVKEKGRDAFLYLVFHHAMTDEWSMNLFRKEFGNLVSGTATSFEWPTPLHTYTDFARWQSWTLSNGLQQRLEAYWKERLSDLGEVVKLVPDHTVSSSVSGRSGKVSGDLGFDLQMKINAYCRQEGLSRFAVWMAIWQILLARLGSGEEVVLATPVSERGQSEWLDVMGMFLNTLPIRTRVNEHTSFRSFSKDCHQLLAKDLAHGQLPFEDIIQISDLDLGAESQGLPQVMFVLHGEQEWSEDETGSNSYRSQSTYVKNQITLHLTERGESCRASLNYDADRFREQTARKILQRFEKIAVQVLSQCDIRIADIDILLPGEHERILEISGRNNIVPYPETTLQDIFRRTAAQYPDRPAVIEADGRETSYEELKRQVDHIACFLRSKGVGRDVVVAVYMQRSPQMLASILGILEAGGAFLLMEPSLPLDRLRSMADQARIAALVTDKAMPVIKEYSVYTHRFDDILNADLAEEHVIEASSDPASLACVIFTSGSTGVPKGAMLEHGNLINYLGEIKDTYSFGSEDRTLQKTLLSFDASLIELMLPMISGGSVVMPEPGVEADMRRLAGIAELHRVSYVFFAPAQLRLFLEVPGIERLNGALKVVACGGESVPDSLVTTHLETLKASLYQIYGPTETSIAVAQWNCRIVHGHPKPPIGWPNANVDILIMNNMGRPVPPGMPGELWIGGAQTGRGYINNEEETRKRFVDDPIEPGSGRRFYRSGDMARFLPDGNLLFLGRIDDQLKVRGVRIELGDVSAALLRCEGIQEAVVLAEPDGEGSNRLRAWVTCKDNFQAKEPAIQSSLSMLLPGYMIPFRIHIIDHIPLTSHGKTDHRALRAYATADADEAEGLPLTTHTEDSLAALWTELLGVSVQNRDADFFRLGGHSLSLLRVQAKIRKKWSIEFDLRRFYGNGTLSEMALQIEATIAGSEKPKFGPEITPLPIGKQGSGPNIYVMIGGDGSMPGFTKYIYMSEWLGNRYNFFAMPDPEAIAGKIPSIPLATLADRYAAAIRDHQPKGSYILMGECIGGFDAFATAAALEKMTLDPIYLLMLDSIGEDFNKPILKKEGKRDKIGQALRSLRIFIGLNDKRDHLFSALKANAIRHRLFDPYWYLEQHPDVDSSGFDPFVQYMNTGWREHRAPASHFDTRICKEIFPTFDPENENPIARFLQEMKGNPHLERVVKKLPTLTDVLTDVIAKYPLFDKEWYLRNNPDVAASDIDPFQHYMQNGYKEHRNPSPIFYPLLYQYLCPDYNAKYQNPILHFALSGIDHPEVESAVLGLKINETRKNILIEQGWFNSKWYLHTYPGVLHYGYDPFAHYVSIGWRLGRKPYPGFQEQVLVKSSPGYVVGKSNPLEFLSIPETAALYLKHLDGQNTPMMPEQQASPEIQLPLKNETNNEMVSLTNSEQVNIIKVRSNIRRNQYKPDHFHGKTFILSSLLLHAVDPLLGWSSQLKGEVQTCLASGDHLSYIWEDLMINTKKIEEYMNAITSDTASTTSSPS